jgi:hypothetical protein
MDIQLDPQHHGPNGSFLLFAGNLLLYIFLSFVTSLEDVDKLTSIAMHIVGALSLSITAYFAWRNNKNKDK